MEAAETPCDVNDRWLKPELYWEAFPMSMSKTWFYLNAHSDGMLDLKTTDCHQPHICTVLLYITLIMYSMMTLP